MGVRSAYELELELAWDRADLLSAESAQTEAGRWTGSDELDSQLLLGLLFIHEALVTVLARWIRQTSGRGACTACAQDRSPAYEYRLLSWRKKGFFAGVRNVFADICHFLAGARHTARLLREPPPDTDI